MEIRETREGEVVVLTPDGSLAGTEETSALESKLAAVQKVGARLLVIDCAGVGQLTSVAIRALLATSRKLARRQGRLVLCGMNPKVRKAFAISGFDKDFTILDSRDGALREVLEPPAPPGKAPKRVGAPSSAPSADVQPPAPPAVSEPPPSPPARPPAAALPVAGGPDPREALASAVLDALGVRTLRLAAAGSRSGKAGDLENAADALLSVLRAGR